MPTTLTIAVAQPECVPYDVAANAAIHAWAIRDAQARVIVFPELSITGYHLDAPAVDTDDSRLGPILDACAETGTTALFGAPTRAQDGSEHISMLAAGLGRTGATPDPCENATPDRVRTPHQTPLRNGTSIGSIEVAYRKVWVHHSEHGRFAPGSAPAAIDVDGWRLGLAICRDTGMPEHQEATAALGIDAYIAGVLDTEGDWRAIEERTRRIAAAHGVWVAVASFAGTTGEGYEHAAGRSRICAPDGRVVAQAGPEVGAIVRTTLVQTAATDDATQRSAD